MPPRVILGKSYNTDTSLHIATAEHYFIVDEQTRRRVTCDLYRTQAGALFLVQRLELFIGTEEGVPEGTTYFPVSYDQAHDFVRGAIVDLPDRRILCMQVDILDESIFPPVPAATAEDVEKYYEYEKKDEDED